jgi:hypothetical protein
VGAESQNTRSHNAGVMGNDTSKGCDTNNEYEYDQEQHAVGYNNVTGIETDSCASLYISEPGAPYCSELIAPDANGYSVWTALNATHSDTTATIAGIDGKMPGVPGKTTGVAGTSNTMEYFLVIDPVGSNSVQIGYSPTKGVTMDLFAKPEFLFQQLCAIILNVSGRPPSADAAASQECVGNVMSYPDVARGTRRKSSGVADAVHQPVVTQRIG